MPSLVHDRDPSIVPDYRIVILVARVVEPHVTSLRGLRRIVAPSCARLIRPGVPESRRRVGARVERDERKAKIADRCVLNEDGRHGVLLDGIQRLETGILLATPVINPPT